MSLFDRRSKTPKKILSRDQTLRLSFYILIEIGFTFFSLVVENSRLVNGFLGIGLLSLGDQWCMYGLAEKI